MKRKHLLVVLIIVVIAILLYFLRYEILVLLLAPSCNAEIYAYLESARNSVKEHIILKNLTEYEINILSKACSEIKKGPIENSIELNGCDIEKFDEIVKEAKLKNYTTYYWLLNLGQRISLFDAQNIILEEGKKFVENEKGCNIFKAVPLTLAQISQISLEGMLYLLETGEFSNCIANKTQKECFLEFTDTLSTFMEKNKLKEISSEDIEKVSVECPKLSCEVYEKIPFNPVLCGVLNERKTHENLIELHKRIHDRIKREVESSDRNIFSKFDLFVYGKSIETCGYCPNVCSRYMEKITPWKYPVV